MSDMLDVDPEGFVFLPPERWVLELTLVHENGDLTVSGHGGTEHLKKGTGVWETYTNFLKDAGIEPKQASPPRPGLSWEVLDRLLLEVTMDLPRSQSELPRTPEIDAARRRLTREVHEMMAEGIMPMPINQ